MPVFDWRVEAAKTVSFNCPELVHTIVAAGQYMQAILQWQNTAD